MNISSELRPLYQLSSVKEEAPAEELNSLSSLAEDAFRQDPIMPTYGGNSAHVSQACPINCAFVCHLATPFSALNKQRPSVIMAPVAREYWASTVTHSPLTTQVNYQLSRVILHELLDIDRTLI